VKVVLPGGSGFLGRHLSQRLTDRGDEVVVLTRGRSAQQDGVRFVQWDAKTVGAWAQELDEADAVVHLAGRRVDVRPTRRNIDDLRASRVDSVRVVGEAVRAVDRPPPVWVQVSTVAIFGDSGDRVIGETTPVPSTGPRQMVGVARAWEEAYAAATDGVERQVLLRCAVAIGGGDPALARLTQLARLGLGGRIGTGRQWVSWISLPDLLHTFERALDDPAMEGLYHVTAPRPLPNAEMMAVLRRIVGRRFGLPSPAPITRLGALALGSDPSLALTGRRCIPRRLVDEGQTFEFEDF
jgi:uncharacterized protein (TIGR01777 family)